MFVSVLQFFFCFCSSRFSHANTCRMYMCVYCDGQGQGGPEQPRQHMLPELRGAVPQPCAAFDATHPLKRFQGRHQPFESSR